MFNGIVESTGKVLDIQNLKGGKEIKFEWENAGDLEIDDSISIEGVCQTVVEQQANTFKVQVVEETLRKTNFYDLKAGDLVNLERSLTLNQPLDGHIVQGHVDTTGTIHNFDEEGADWLLDISFDDDEWGDMIVGRGSIAIDGISFTVADLHPGLFRVAVIPYTYEITSLRQKKAGDRVNIEFDILGKYVIRYLQRRESES